MHSIKRWTFTAWWAAAALTWALSSRAGLASAPGVAAKQFEFLAPIWGAPWAIPLAAIRAIGPESGVPFNFELALALGLASCLLLDMRRRTLPARAAQAT